MAMAATHKDIAITRRSQERFLCQELRNRINGVQCTEVAPQVVEISGVSHHDLAAYPLFFSAQLLPDAFPVTAPSIKGWAGAILDHLIQTISDSTSSWSIHIFDPATAESGTIYARAGLITKELRELLKAKRRSLLRSLREIPEQDSSLVQVALTSPTQGYISISTPQTRTLLGASISDHPAGFVSIADDKAPPSRAFKKLREAIAIFRLSISKGNTSVDLGASPGGWSHVLAQHGASVAAIDRSPLEGEISRNKKVAFIKGNAFTWTPPAPVDWLVCDVITTPDRTLEILRTWISKKLCRNFCVTVKFKGDPDIPTLHQIVSYLKSNTDWCDGRQLTHNKNEVTVVGRISAD
jgi:23S rRNA C2498 (ribose-2'-O)-methylase RlmM